MAGAQLALKPHECSKNSLPRKAECTVHSTISHCFGGLKGNLELGNTSHSYLSKILIKNGHTALRMWRKCRRESDERSKQMEVGTVPFQLLPNVILSIQPAIRFHLLHVLLFSHESYLLVWHLSFRFLLKRVTNYRCNWLYKRSSECLWITELKDEFILPLMHGVFIICIFPWTFVGWLIV